MNDNKSLTPELFSELLGIKNKDLLPYLSSLIRAKSEIIKNTK